MLKKLRLTARKLLSCKVVSAKVTRSGMEQRAAIARSQNRVQYYEVARS